MNSRRTAVSLAVALLVAAPDAGGQTQGAADCSDPLDSARQEGLCGPDVSLSTYDAGDCPGIRLDDGMCDAFFVSWNATQNSFSWTRH